MRTRLLIPIWLVILAHAVIYTPAQQPSPLPSKEQIAEILKNVAKYQEAALMHEGVHFRYRTHRVDRKEDTTRDLIETSEGNIARLVLHNGQAVTRDEDAGERNRLEKLLDSGDLRRKQKEEQRSRGYGVEMIRAMPTAMLYTPTAGQPQLPGIDRHQLVLDFVPNPEFRAHTLAEGVLDGITGRLWIDQADHHLVRVELNVSHDLNLAWGMLAKVYKGGTIEYQQQRLPNGLYHFAHVQMSLKLRELMVKSVPYESDLTAFDVHPLEKTPGAAEAIRMLLNENVPVR